jgi:hypothetical protein
MGWLRSLRTLSGYKKNFIVQGIINKRKNTAETIMHMQDRDVTHEYFRNEIARGITAVPMTAANQAGLKCSVIDRGVALNGNDIFISPYQCAFYM